MQWVSSTIVPYEQIDSNQLLRKIEYACRTCYQSYDKIGEGSAERLIRSCIKRGHESVLEHASLTFVVTCDRSVLAQWTRHRMASYAVESQRYCNYTFDKFDNQIVCVYPAWYEEPETNNPKHEQFCIIQQACENAERIYFELIKMGMPPEEARAILPNAAKCTMIWTANMREIRHFIRLRASKGADPNIRRLAKQLLQIMVDNGLTVLVEDLLEELNV